MKIGLAVSKQLIEVLIETAGFLITMIKSLQYVESQLADLVSTRLGYNQINCII